jgi:hypothetical protein
MVDLANVAGLFLNEQLAETDVHQKLQKTLHRVH